MRPNIMLCGYVRRQAYERRAAAVGWRVRGTGCTSSFAARPSSADIASLITSQSMVGTWLRLALVCLSARGAASFDSGGDVPGSPGNLADAMRGAAWPASLCTARLHH